MNGVMMSQEQEQRDFMQFVQTALPSVMKALGNVFAAGQSQQGGGGSRGAGATLEPPQMAGGGAEQSERWAWAIPIAISAAQWALKNREMEPTYGGSRGAGATLEPPQMAGGGAERGWGKWLPVAMDIATQLMK
jgi:hypothetical protein